MKTIAALVLLVLVMASAQQPIDLDNLNDPRVRDLIYTRQQQLGSRNWTTPRPVVETSDTTDTQDSIASPSTSTDSLMRELFGDLSVAGRVVEHCIEGSQIGRGNSSKVNTQAPSAKKPTKIGKNLFCPLCGHCLSCDGLDEWDECPDCGARLDEH